jgi:phasin family protein
VAFEAYAATQQKNCMESFMPNARAKRPATPANSNFQKFPKPSSFRTASSGNDAQAVNDDQPSLFSTPKTAAKSNPMKTKTRSNTASKSKAKSNAKKKSSGSRKTTTSRAKEAVSTAKKQAAFNSVHTAQTTQRVVKMHADTMKDLMSKGAKDTREAQSKLFDISREGAAQFARTAEKATDTINDAVAQTRGTLEACIESANTAADMAKSLTNEMFRYANESFSENVEITKDVFTCRTINDVLDLQNKLMRANVDSFFNETMRLSEMFFDYSSEASAPLNQRLTQAAETMQKRFTA